MNKNNDTTKVYRVMANDVANIIYELAKNDKSLTELTLQEMYREKSRQDSEKTKQKLYDIVSKHISDNLQPGNNSIELSEDVIEGGSFKSYKGAVRLSNYTPDEYTFYCKTTKTYYTVNEMKSKHLIKSGIIPLNLKWYGKTSKDGGGNIIVIDWSHWESQE